MSGVLVAVVGASGAGKDSVISEALTRLRDRGVDVEWAVRDITRFGGPGEDHRPVSPAEFADTSAAGGYLVSWEAHGLNYGVPMSVLEALDRGAVVVVNLSRGAVDQLRARVGAVRVVRISVPESIRAERIAQRGRETGEQARARLARVDPAPDLIVDLDIVNDGSVEEAGAQLTALVLRSADVANVESVN